MASVGPCNLILHIHFVVIWKLSKQGICWPVSHDCIAGAGVNPSRLRVFLKFFADKLLSFWLIVGSTLSRCLLLIGWFQKISISTTEGIDLHRYLHLQRKHLRLLTEFQNAQSPCPQNCSCNSEWKLKNKTKLTFAHIIPIGSIENTPGFHSQYLQIVYEPWEYHEIYSGKKLRLISIWLL